MPNFWDRASEWRNKGWTIAQHGCHHLYRPEIRSEFTGLSYNEQLCLLEYGYNILLERNLAPSCFFAPAHHFDAVTVRACRDSGHYRFISDGVAFYPYIENGMIFFPSMFDTPHAISPWGIFTFVCHPNQLNACGITSLENFLKRHRARFDHSADELMDIVTPRSNRTLLDRFAEYLITALRQVRR